MRDSGIGDGGTPRDRQGPRPPPARRRLRCRLGLERNDLRRRVDRGQRWTALGLLALMLLVAAPVAVWAGRWAHDSGVRAERQEQADRRQVVATVVADNGTGAAGDHYIHETIKVTWKHPDTSGKAAESRTGILPSWKGAKVGTKKTIWVDDKGGPVGRPRPHSLTVTDAAYAAGSSVLGVGVPFLVAYLILRHRCDRRRYDMWDAAWARMDAQRGSNSS